MLWEALLQLDRPDLGLDDRLLLVAGQRLWRDLHVQNAVLIEAHRRETARLDRRDQHRQQRLLDRLADGAGVDAAVAGEAAAAFGIGTAEPVACVLSPLDDSLDEPLHGIDVRLERAGLSSFWHTRGGAQFGLVPLGKLDGDGLVDLVRPVVATRVAVGVASDGVAGFAAIYQLAARAAQTLPRGRPNVVLVTDRLPELLLAGNPDVSGLLVEEAVGPLLSHPQGTVLLDTLAALIASNGSPTRAATELWCHRNTVLYRLKQIEELTGHSLESPRDRQMFALALTALGRSVLPREQHPSG